MKIYCDLNQLETPHRGVSTMLSILNLSKHFDTVHALDEVSFRVPAEEFVTIIGASGCGKSTLFRILAGLIEADSGEILLDGSPIDDKEARRGRFGYMPQRDALLPWRTVLQNVTLGAEVDGTLSDETRLQAEELLPMFGLDGFGEAWPATLSGGMRQRAALLRTFLTGRDILLLDEPFGALDPVQAIQMAPHLSSVYVSGWQCSSTASTTNEPGPDFAE